MYAYVSFKKNRFGCDGSTFTTIQGYNLLFPTNTVATGNFSVSDCRALIYANISYDNEQGGSVSWSGSVATVTAITNTAASLALSASTNQSFEVIGQGLSLVKTYMR